MDKQAVYLRERTGNIAKGKEMEIEHLDIYSLQVASPKPKLGNCGYGLKDEQPVSIHVPRQVIQI